MIGIEEREREGERESCTYMFNYCLLDVALLLIHVDKEEGEFLCFSQTCALSRRCWLHAHTRTANNGNVYSPSRKMRGELSDGRSSFEKFSLVLY